MLAEPSGAPAGEGAVHDAGLRVADVGTAGSGGENGMAPEEGTGIAATEPYPFAAGGETGDVQGVARRSALCQSLEAAAVTKRPERSQSVTSFFP